MSDAPGPPAYPRATLRLQFHAEFGFDAAAAIVPYAASLGVSHIYASPFLKARAGSTHGYDIVDHGQFNPEVGDAESFERFVDALHRHGLGLILDFVPNHMGIGSADNGWWLDVLEWGERSPFAKFFDIDWAPAEPSLHGKVLLPVLGDHYGAILENGDLSLRFDAEAGTFSLWYFTHRFPIAPRTYAPILRAALGDLKPDDRAILETLATAFTRIRRGGRSVQAQLAVRREADGLKTQLAAAAADRPAVRAALDRATDTLDGEPGRRDSMTELHRLLEAQSYRLAFWRVAADEINYRRFFDINELAGLRIEEPELFELAHQLVFRLIGEGKLQGLRLDHVDGLYDPKAYCEKLQDRAAYLALQAGRAAPAPLAQPIYLLVEKILARHERLRDDWPVAGTTGYEFMNLVNGLLVDPAGERPITETYQRFTGTVEPYEDIQLEAKRLIIRRNLSSELFVLAGMLNRLAKQSWDSRDFTLTGLREALTNIVAFFPVYRTYITQAGTSDADRRDLDWAVAQATKAAGPADSSIYRFIHAVLTTDLKSKRGFGYRRADILRTAMKLQQFSGPVMAKAVEDTAFYRYVRLISLNDVGDEPTRFGVSPTAFHHVNQDRLKRHPFSMLATATHDHKRGEDTRARIDVLSERPRDWDQRLRRWAKLNGRRRSEVDDRPAPSRNDEYLLYQTLVGAWPLDLRGPDFPGIDGFADRIAAYMTKAVREAKLRSSWAAPDAGYEQAVEGFVRGILDPRGNRPFLADMEGFQAMIAPAGAVNGLAQTLLKLTVPGVPDLYQGTEYWDLSLVDPDNRRPVDYDARRRSLDGATSGTHAAALLDAWTDGRVKQHVIRTALAVRARHPDLFAAGDYGALEPTGAKAAHVVAFARRRDEACLVAVAPRLTAAMIDGDLPLPAPDSWGDTALSLNEAGLSGTVVDLMTGRTIHLGPTGAVSMTDLLATFPVALLANGVAA
ncbi:MAG: malto-oligosyltrehalose synthase [Inquilinaceae bacterium]